MKLQYQSTALIFWLCLLVLQLVFIQGLGWIIRWRPEVFRKLEDRYSLLFGKPLSPERMLVAGTLFFWTPSLILLRFHSGEAWRVPSYAVVVVPFLLAIPCYFIGKSAAIDPRIRTRVAGSEHVRWSYSLGGIFLATGAVALPVFISLLSGMDEMLSSLCTSMAFVSGTLLPCIFGFIKGMTNSGPFKINRG